MPFRLRDCLPFAGLGVQKFKFLDTGPLVDGELELVTPSLRWVDSVLAACRHPMSLEQSSALSDTSRQQIVDFLKACPDGHQAAKPSSDMSPAYHFWMHLRNNSELPIAGGLNLRIGHQFELVMYHGQIGYHVYPPLRGNHYAERACRLLLPLARRHGIDPVWITCNPDNFASRRTCERLGGKLVEIVPVPAENPLFARGEIEKCRYRIDLT
jgi:tagatose 1,6-diphosphate aldolase